MNEEKELSLFLEMQKRGKERRDLIHSEEGLDIFLGSFPGSYPVIKRFSSPPAQKTRSNDILNFNSDKNEYNWLITPPKTPLLPTLDMESKTATSPAATRKARPIVLTSKFEDQLKPALRRNITSKKPILTAGFNSSKYSRASTPTSRPLFPSSKPAATKTRSSTPVTRSSTPTFRPTFPASKSATRSTTPTARTSSITTSGPTITKRTVTSRGSSPTVRSRPWKPSDMPGFTLDAPPNLRTSMFNRSISAFRGRQGVFGSDRNSSRKSCSPSRTRVPNAVKHEHYNHQDNISPVLIGTKMVERVVNMRKLAPPNQDLNHNHNSLSKNVSSSLSSLGLGRTISRSSLDMALRHMDIRGLKGNLKPLRTNHPASSVYTVKSGPPRSGTVSVTDSPLATSSNASSDTSVNSHVFRFNGSELDDDQESETGLQSYPSSVVKGDL